MIIPPGWTIARLDQVADWSSGGTPKAGRRAYYGGDIPWAVIGDLADGAVRATANSITQLGLENSSAKIVPAGSVLVAMYGSIGKLGVAGLPMATNQAIAIAQPREGISREFLFYYLMSQRDLLNAAGRGGTQRNISQSILKPWPIPLPPLGEQRQIVETIEDHLSRLDAAQRNLQSGRARALGLLDVELRRWRTEAFARSVREYRIRDLADTTLGKMLDAKRAEGDPTPYLANFNVRWGEFDLSEVRETRLTDAERQRLELRAGDILACEGGEPGRCAVWPTDGSGVTFQKALHRIRVRNRDEVLPEFFALMLRATIKSRRVDRLFTGTTIKHLPQEKLRTISLPVPDMTEQQRCLTAWASLNDDVRRLVSSIQSAETRAAHLRRAVLAAAFSGRLTDTASDNDIIEEIGAQR